MSRTVVAFVVLAALALAPGAAAKGPHAIVEPGPGGIAPGERWVAALNLIEFSGRELTRTRPRVVLHSGAERIVVRPVGLGRGRYEFSAAFPRAGRWSYAVIDGGRRFEFPSVVIGRGLERDTTAFVAFPEGSRAEREGGGGPILGDGTPPAGGKPLPPEVVMTAAPRGDGDGGLPLWIPVAGLALAGAGTITLVRRRLR